MPGSESRKIEAESYEDMSTTYRAPSPSRMMMPVATKFIGSLLHEGVGLSIEESAEPGKVRDAQREHG
jgi:hypothetical protein